MEYSEEGQKRDPTTIDNFLIPPFSPVDVFELWHDRLPSPPPRAPSAARLWCRPFLVRTADRFWCLPFLADFQGREAGLVSSGPGTTASAVSTSRSDDSRAVRPLSKSTTSDGVFHRVATEQAVRGARQRTTLGVGVRRDPGSDQRLQVRAEARRGRIRRRLQGLRPPARPQRGSHRRRRQAPQPAGSPGLQHWEKKKTLSVPVNQEQKGQTSSSFSKVILASFSLPD